MIHALHADVGLCHVQYPLSLLTVGDDVHAGGTQVVDEQVTENLLIMV
ncbi:MAG: hypothetical protein PUD15_08665 [Prevotella sp.]|nr:hypothetical protein [Prevotella sp.]